MASHSSSRGVFVLSVALPAAAMRSAGFAMHQDSANLIRRVRSHQIAATWSVPFGTNLAQFADMLGGNAAAGELAWLADGEWAGRGIGRGRFAMALAERQAAAMDAGLSMSTLTVAGEGVPAHLDVTAKYGINALVRTAQAGGSRRTEPQTLRYGVWGVPATVQLGDSGGWWSNQARRATAEIDRAIRANATCCLHLDGSRSELLAVLERVMAHVQRRRVEGRLHVETVGQVAARLAQPKVAARPARSILRAA